MFLPSKRFLFKLTLIASRASDYKKKREEEKWVKKKLRASKQRCNGLHVSRTRFCLKGLRCPSVLLFQHRVVFNAISVIPVAVVNSCSIHLSRITEFICSSVVVFSLQDGRQPPVKRKVGRVSNGFCVFQGRVRKSKAIKFGTSTVG